MKKNYNRRESDVDNCGTYDTLFKPEKNVEDAFSGKILTFRTPCASA